MAQEQSVTEKNIPAQPELIEQTETLVEQTAESTPALSPSTQESAPVTAFAPPPAAPAPTFAPPIDELQKKVEDVLSENLSELYKQLPADKKKLFREQGEAVARSVSAMMRAGVMHIKNVLQLIRNWLLMIPGVNKFFLEQEAKIKTDKIQNLYNQHAHT